jgi:hypothetical protein
MHGAARGAEADLRAGAAQAWRRGARGEPFPLAAVLGRAWAHAPGQLAFLRWATAAPPEVFSFEGVPRRLAPLEGLAAGRSSVGTPNQAWLALDLYAALARLDEAGLSAGVRALLEPPAKACPEVRPGLRGPAPGQGLRACLVQVEDQLVPLDACGEG